MRGDDPRQAALFSYLSPEERMPTEHPLRAIRAMVDGVLTELSCPFDARYADTDRPSMAPEQWLRALRLPVLYTIRRERLLLEQLGYNILCRWCVELNMNDAA
jgi:transposase